MEYHIGIDTTKGSFGGNFNLSLFEIPKKISELIETTTKPNSKIFIFVWCYQNGRSFVKHTSRKFVYTKKFQKTLVKLFYPKD